MKNSAIAIVGMAGRFPGARNIDEFWRNLRDGVETIRTLSDAELLAAGATPDELARPDYVKAAAVLDGIEMFDASFFGFSPKDAAIMDPQHRHFLECAWEALEHAGHMPERFDGSIGVFAGSGMNAYLVHNLLRNRRLVESAGLFLLRQTGNDKDVLATRVSYQFDLRGPSLSVQTACSTSLVAVHLACQSLLASECDMALAGGVTIEVPHGRGYVYREGEILSRDGHCRSFDAESSGTIFSSGVGLVVLRRLEDALADRDTIHAVILGSAINNDGQRKVGFLAPSVAGQADVIAEALDVAGVSPEQISYVETHGTGTTVGDPIEIKALTQAFRAQSQRAGYCAIGSLKSNVGHLDAAAGVAGLIKSVLALEHRQLPASLHFHTPNPQIDFPSTPFYVNTALADWPGSSAPRRAGVTSLGIGGTNAHVVLEEAPPLERSLAQDRYHLLPLAARSETALAAVASQMARHLEENPQLRLADVARTCQVGRREFRHRRVVVARDTADAARLLATTESRTTYTGQVPAQPPKIVFMFSGQGTQYVRMAADLYANQPAFRDCLDRCAEIVQPHVGLDLRKVLYSDATDEAAAVQALNTTALAQPALFAIEYSLAHWWMSVGVRPAAMVGHSIGEYVAACLAGVFTLEDALAIAAARGRLMQDCQPGAMLAVSLAPDEVRLSGDLSLAAVNAPRQCVLSGPADQIDRLERELSRDSVICHRLATSHAFHSAMMEPAVAPFVARLREITLRPPQTPFVSNLTGGWITPAEATDPQYWGRHLRHTVRFADCVRALVDDRRPLLLEIGPGQVLTSLARQTAGDHVATIGSLRRREESVNDSVLLLGAAGQLWIRGLSIKWSGLTANEPAMRVPLPSYPFERQRYWIAADPDPSAGQQTIPPAAAPQPTPAPHPAAATEIVGSPTSIGNWFYRRRWSRAAHPAAASLEPGCWVVMLDATGLGQQISLQLRGAGHEVIEVIAGQAFRRVSAGEFTVRPGELADYRSLLADLARQKRTPQRIIHLWCLGSGTAETSTAERLDQCFYSLLFLAQALADSAVSDVDLAVVTDRLHPVDGHESGDPLSATALGPIKVIPKEMPSVKCRNIDVDLTALAPGALAVEIINEHRAAADAVVALREGERWTEGMELTGLPATMEQTALRSGGVYVITGGLGDLALVIAERLAREFRAKLVLLARTPLPPREQWEQTLGAARTAESTKQTIRKLRALESSGAEVLTIACDVTRPEDLRRALATAVARFGPINGVIHAAGIVDDGPLATKTRAAAARVLAPKVQGTLALAEVLKELGRDPRQREALDFLALFSSVSSVLAPAGQVDYVAANAFLDAFATGTRDTRVVAINWGPWRDVGMAARLRTTHPLLARRLINSADELSHAVALQYDHDWVLAEHRLTTGRAVLPGTGYLEMACAALVQGDFGTGVEFEDVFFVAPFFAEPGETREAYVHLHRRAGQAYQFSVRGRDGDSTEYALGQIARGRRAAPADQSIAAIRARCQQRTLTFDDTRRTEQERFFAFGSRWRNLNAIHFGMDEALSELALAPQREADVSTYRLHPALLDLATGSALYLIAGYEQSQAMYFPLSYRRATFYRPMPARLFSHIRQREPNVAGQDLAVFDVTLLDEHGRVLGEIEQFAMRLVRNPQQTLATELAQREDAASKAHAVETGGISPALGATAFARIMAADVNGGIVVLPDGLATAVDSTGMAARLLTTSSRGSEDVEATLAGWWQELLGVEQVGPDDDFFELGGHSLIVVRLFSEIKKTYGATFPLSTLFEARTIRQLSQLVRDASHEPERVAKTSTTLVAIQPKGTRPPLYVISGLGGNVIKFHTMAFHLGEDQPVYGLLPRGLDGREPYHTRVEDMAAHYVQAILQAQPQGPYHLVGYSFGGAVALEVAQQLIAQGRDVGLLGMFDTIEWRYMEQVDRAARSQNGNAGGGAPNTGEAAGEDPFSNLHSRVKAKAIRGIYRLFHALGRPVPQSIGTIEDVNAFAGANYRPKTYPRTLTLFRATSRRPLDGDDPYLGWGDLISGGIEVHHIPATHLNILQEPGVTVLAEKLHVCLDREPAREAQPAAAGSSGR